MWLAIGLLAGAGIIALWLWLRLKGVKVAWYAWLIAIIGVLLVFFAIENARASLTEFENAAAWNSLLIFGLPGLLLVILSGLLVWIRARRQTHRPC